jgi:Arc/MetJ-type ribon-helix-helix transcriptional regulator
MAYSDTLWSKNEGEFAVPITLRPEHERLIAEALRSGTYRSPDEVIERALELLRDRDAWLAENARRSKRATPPLSGET